MNTILSSVHAYPGRPRVVRPVVALALSLSLSNGFAAAIVGPPPDPTDPVRPPIVFRSCPSSSGYAPPGITFIASTSLLQGPSLCDSTPDKPACENHMLYEPFDPKDPLVVFLPGTNMAPDYHDVVLNTAAQAGFRALGLAYDNTELVGDTCAGEPGCEHNCRDLVRRERITGNDLHNGLDVEKEDSVLVRLYRVLAHLDSTRPGDGWDEFYVPSPTGNVKMRHIVWDKLIMSGFSQGAGHAERVSFARQVHGLVLLDGGLDLCTDPVNGDLVPSNWLSGVDASAGRPKYVVAHRRGAPIPDNVLDVMDLLGVGGSHDLDGSLSDVIDKIPPAGFSHTDQAFEINPLTGNPIPVSSPDKPGVECDEHLSMARDSCMPSDVVATPGTSATSYPPDTRLYGPYLRRFCYACDIATCP